MKKIFLGLATLSLLLTSTLDAKEYGNSAKDWKSFTSLKGKVIQEYHQVKFEGNGTRTGFYTKLEKGTTVNWAINSYSRYFKVYIQIMTTKGIRYLTYYPLDKDLGKKGRFLQFGLGSYARIGEKHNYKPVSFSRDIQADLEKFDKGNKLVDIKAFFIRGSVRLSHLEVVNGNSAHYIARAKLANMMNAFAPENSNMITFPGDTPLIGVQTTEYMMGYMTSFVTLSKDEKEVVGLNIIKYSESCADGIKFKKNNTILELNYPPIDTKYTEGTIQSIYDISDIYNPRKISEKYMKNVECK